MPAQSDAKRVPSIPLPQLQDVDNTTAYPHLAFDKMGKGRLFYDVVICKASFTLEAGVLRPAARKLSIELADRYWDEAAAESSSIKVAGDVLLYKPGTDVLVTGTARTTDGRPRASWLASVSVLRNGQVCVQHGMRLCGPRVWRHSLLRDWYLDEPALTDRVPLRHELAYGGSHKARRLMADQAPDQPPSAVFEINPAGSGYWDVRRLDKSATYPGPQIETPSEPIKKIGARYPLATPAPLARFWADRTCHGGTYDQAWRRQFETSAIPDYPPDFDDRFFQCAHPNLRTSSHLHGDEQILLEGMVPNGQAALYCALPNIQIRADLHGTSGKDEQRTMALDTVHIDLDGAKVALVWRLTLDQREGFAHVRLCETTTSKGA